MRKSPTPVAGRLPVAHSYLRFSTPRQQWGDSTRRQVEGTQAWSARTGVPLSDLSLASLGVSAYDGKHRSEKQALGWFLELAKQGNGRVRRGDYLVIENLDRLSREEEVPATHLLTSILMAGIKVVQLSPYEMELTDKSDGWTIMRAVMELSRGHSESRMKSVRVAAAWAEKVAQARAKGEPLTHRLPAWIEERDGRPRVIPERAAVVKRMFELTAQGHGAAAVARMLEEEKVPPFGDYVLDGNGRRKAKEGKPLGCGAWRRIYVSMILRDRRALGEFQPKGKGRRPDGPPIPNYYPPVVSEEELYAARAAIAAHKQVPGRFGTGVANLFTGLIHDARIVGGTYSIGQRVDRGRMSRILMSSGLPDGSGHGGAGRGRSFPYPTFERAILTCLRELDPAEVLVLL